MPAYFNTFTLRIVTGRQTDSRKELQNCQVNLKAHTQRRTDTLATV